MKKLVSTLIFALMLVACSQQNPFFSEWKTPFGLPPFEKIKNEHYLPAFKQGIEQQQAEIDAIVNNSEAPTFENTIAQFEHSGVLLSKVSLVFFNLTSAETNDDLQAIAEEVSPLLSEHADNIYLNDGFYKRVAELYEKRDALGLTGEQMKVLENHYKNFIRSGAALAPEAKERLRVINKELAALELKFGDNVLKETNNYQLVIDKKEDLAGLPQSAIDAAAEEAKAVGQEGKWVFKLQKPSWIPFMQYADNRDLRKEMFLAYANRGNNNNEFDNKAIVEQLMKLRIEKANLLGFATSADFILDNTMAKTSVKVNDFLKTVFTPAVVKAKEEVIDMQKMIDREKGGFKLEPWDWFYYAEKVRKDKYALDEDEIKQYFKMENVRQGVFDVASKLYGLKFKKLDNMPIYHPDVETFEVSDADGSLIGIFYTDYYPRAGKRAGAWMSNYREQQVKDGVNIRPIVVNVGNFTKPTASKPSLLTMDEVETLFHEFGHALHGLLAQCNYLSVSGTNVARDFVELPSQILENWAFEPEVLKSYAFHYESGEVIPDSLIKKIQSASTFNQGFATTELTAAAILDMNWHDLKSVDGVTVEAFEKESMAKAGLIGEIIPRYRTTYFNHVFGGGYSAGYYSYLWAEVLDKDAYDLFKENGIFDQATATAFRKNILEKGGSEEPMSLYIKFRGAEPNPEAMLKGRGLK